MAKGPTPQQQADYLVRKLEQTIRDNRSDKKGMSFATWQAIAREEIANALAAAERRHRENGQSALRLMVVSACSLITMGFWGAMAAVDRAYGGTAALIMLAAGAALMLVLGPWAVRRLLGAHDDHARARRLANIEDLDRRIKRMEQEMRRKHDRLKEKLESVGEL